MMNKKRVEEFVAMGGSKDILVNVLGEEIRIGFNKSTLFITSYIVS